MSELAEQLLDAMLNNLTDVTFITTSASEAALMLVAVAERMPTEHRPIEIRVRELPPSDPRLAPWAEPGPAR